MKTDSFAASLVWGRIGAAVLAILAFVLQTFDIEFGAEDQAGANATIGGILAGIAGLLALVSKFREQYKARQSQAGSARTALLVCLSLLCLASLGILASAMMIGCGHRAGATQQLISQTDKPAVIALGTYADAQDLYIEAQELYLPYQPALKKSNPALDAEIVGLFRKADKVLSDWELFGDVPTGDKESFRAYLRDISIKLAQALETKQKGGE